METTIDKLRENIIEHSVSKKFAKELEELVKEDGYDSIKFFIAPDKTVSASSVIEDVRAYFNAKKTNSDEIREFSSL